MRICVLHPSYEQSSSAFKGYDPASEPARFLPEHEWHQAFLDKATAVREVQRLATQGFDVFVNLCDGAWDEDRAGIEVVQTLERLGLAFTGPSSDFYDPSRHSMKLAASYAGVTVPPFAFIDDPTKLGAALELRFPLIVKHPSSYSSIGLTPASRVTNVAELEAQVARMFAEYGGALVEEFIDGGEATVLVTEARPGVAEEAWALVPFECLLGAPENFKHFDLKWKDYESIKWRAVEDAALAAKLKDAAARVFGGLRGSGFARCDFRVDKNGDVHFLEINPMCGVFYPEGAYGSADFILAAEPGGHRAFLKHLIASSLQRRDRNRPTLAIRHSPGARLRRARGAGLRAGRGDRSPGGAAAAPGDAAPRREGLHFDPAPVVRRVRVPVLRERLRDVERSAGGLAPLQPQLRSERLARRAGRGGAAGDRAERGGDARLRDLLRAGDEGVPLPVPDGGVPRRAHRVGPPDGADFCLRRSRQRLRRRGARAQRAAGPRDRPARRGALHLAVVAAAARRRGAVRHRFPSIEKKRYSLEIDEDVHGEILPTALRLMSHSCAPNLTFDLPNRRLLVIRDIAPGEQFSFFYPSTEWDMAEPFACWCGAPECIGNVRGAKHIDREVLRRYQLAPHIKRLAGL